MIEWSLDAFRASECVRSIVVAVPPGHIHELGGHDLAVVSGGDTRAQSVGNALAAVGTELVAIHDAARPLLTPALVEALVADLEADPEAAGVIAAAPLTDTVKRAEASQPPVEGTRPAFVRHSNTNAGRVIKQTLDRSQLWAAQTPQVFRAEALRAALASAERPEEATDESMLVEAAGGRVLIHPVAEPNLKVTTPLDHALAEVLLAARGGGPWPGPSTG